MGFEPDRFGQFRVSIASENTSNILGHTPEALFAIQSFSNVLATPDRADFTRRLYSILNIVPSQNPAHLDIFQCSILSMESDVKPFWCTAHKSGNQQNLIVCEFEPLHEILDPYHSMPLRQEPTKLLNYHPSVKEWERSTIRTSKPLHFVQNSTHSTSSVHSVELIGAMHEIQSQLITTTSIDMLFGIIVGTISELTGFDRVMVYRFDECKCGAVVAEYLDPKASEDLFIGLHFPSSDLPQWIRNLYQADRVQILRNRTSETASLVYLSTDSTPSLDMTRSYLREITPEKVQLFSDLEISSAMNISLVVDGDLWGLITCHSYRSKVVEISPPLREVCRSIGDCVSSQIEREQVSTFQEHQLIQFKVYYTQKGLRLECFLPQDSPKIHRLYSLLVRQRACLTYSPRNLECS